MLNRTIRQLKENEPLGLGISYVKDSDGTIRQYMMFDDVFRVDVVEPSDELDPDDAITRIVRLNPKESQPTYPR